MYCKNCGNENFENGICTVCGQPAQAETEQQCCGCEDTQVNAEEQAYGYEEAQINAQEQGYGYGYGYGEPQYDGFDAPVETPDAGKSLGIAALACGIFSFVGGSVCTCIASMLGGLLPGVAAVAAVILGILALGKSKASGHKNILAIVGIALGALSVVVIGVLIIVNMVAGGIMGAAMAAGEYYY